MAWHLDTRAWQLAGAGAVQRRLAWRIAIHAGMVLISNVERKPLMTLIQTRNLRLFAASTALVALAGLTACGPKSEAPAPAPSPAPSESPGVSFGPGPAQRPASGANGS